MRAKSEACARSEESNSSNACVLFERGGELSKTLIRDDVDERASSSTGDNGNGDSGRLESTLSSWSSCEFVSASKSPSMDEKLGF